MCKLVTLSKAQQIIRENENKTIGLTNGCFDVIHKGHIHSLRESKKQCDILFVILNSDNSIKELSKLKRKPDNRPYQDQENRIEVLSSIKYVDYIILNDCYNCAIQIIAIGPDVYCKSEEYKNNQDPLELQALNITKSDIYWIPMIESNHSTDIINKINGGNK